MPYLCCLLERLLRCSHKDDGVWAKAILSRGLHILGDVLGLLEVDESVRAKLLHAHLPLILTSIDRNGPQAHSLGVLLSEGSETTATANNAHSLAWPGTRLLQALVDSDTCAQDWGDGVERHVLWDLGSVCALNNAVLLEGSINGVSREKSLRAKWLIFKK